MNYRVIAHIVLIITILTALRLEAQDNGRYKRIFNKEYFENEYPIYKGDITLKKQEVSTKVIYDTIALIIEDRDSVFIHLFRSGLIYPEMLSCYKKEGCLVNIDDLGYLNKKKSTRRLQVLIWNTEYIHPEIILIEITNKKAKKNMDMEKFIQGAEVTFVYETGMIVH